MTYLKNIFLLKFFLTDFFFLFLFKNNVFIVLKQKNFFCFLFQNWTKNIFFCFCFNKIYFFILNRKMEKKLLIVLKTKLLFLNVSKCFKTIRFQNDRFESFQNDFFVSVFVQCYTIILAGYTLFVEEYIKEKTRF